MAASKPRKNQTKAEKDKNRRRSRTLRELAVWFLCLFAVLAAFCVGAFANGVRERKAASELASGDEYRGTVALSCGETKLSLMELSFYFYDRYYGIAESDNFAWDYRAFGLDETKPLRSSEYTVSRSWFDKLAEDALEAAKSTARYAEKARQSGTPLSAEGEAEVEAKMAELAERAQKEGRGLDEYLGYRYCPGMTEADARAALELYKAAEKQYNADLEELTRYGAGEIEDYYDAHRNELDTADCVKYIFRGDSEAAVREKAKRFADCKSSGQFADLIKQDLLAAGCNEKQANSELLNCRVRLSAGDTGEPGDTGELAKWAFQPGRVKGETKAWFDGGKCLVGYMERPGGKYTFPSANVRGLYISGRLFSDPQQAKAKAEELYEKALKGGTEEYFIQLVKENSQDTGTASYGGEIADIVPGDLSEAYNDWVFAEGRKPGDIGLVQSDGDYHIFYYLRDGAPCWEVSARNAMTDERVRAHQEEIEKSLAVVSDTADAYAALPDDLAVEHGAKGGFYLAFYLLFGLSTAALAAALCCGTAALQLKKRRGGGK